VTITRHFQGWETASLPAATALLTHNWVQSGCTGPLDLRNSLLLVPTRHAGRRLRGELARVAADQGTAVLAGTIVTPEHLVPQSPNAASDDLLLALLAQQLRTRHADFTALLPNQQDASWNFPFALGIATQLQEVRRQLNEACLTASELIPKVPEEEQARWQDIARLEQGLIQDLEQHGLQDPLQARLEAEQQVPAVFPYDRILSLFIPDLSERTVRTLKTLSELCDVELHILAPEAEADRFDEWGRPRPDAWEGRPLPIPENQIVVYEQGEDETESLARWVAEAEDNHLALALCTPDPAPALALARRLQSQGRELYLPNGIPLSATAPGQLLMDWLTLLRQGNYVSGAAFLRNPDAQDWLAVVAVPCPVENLLSELDACQNQHLPSSFEELRRFSDSNSRNPTLSRALDAIHTARALPPSEFLSTLYDCRPPETSEDPLFADAAQALARLIQQTEASATSAGLSQEEMLDLLLTTLPMQQIFPKPNSADAREALGWLEIQWETAPTLILSELREGIIPETRVGDAFLPDSIRVAAGMAGNRESFARDLFLTHTLLASRPEGAVRFLTSRRAANQDPQLPSRILTACPDLELPDRVSLLFEKPARHRPDTAAGHPNLMLTPPACTLDQIPQHLSVTGFKAYLACPFRFYLSKVLHMEAYEDSARELDALLFGSLAHEVLEILSPHPDLADENQIRELLLNELDRLFTKQFGKRPSLVLTVQLESLRQRLRAAARVQAETVREGWQIVSGEEEYIAKLEGMSIHGRIDRIEQHRDGRIRILDYKTSDSGTDPLKAHYQTGNKKWLELQLPLYRYMYALENPEAATPEVGYFNLPKAVTETGIRLMDFTGKDGDLYEPAIDTARQVVKDIQAGLFWPPEQVKPDWDTFAALAPNDLDLIHEVPPL